MVTLGVQNDVHSEVTRFTFLGLLRTFYFMKTGQQIVVSVDTFFTNKAISMLIVHFIITFIFMIICVTKDQLETKLSNNYL